MVYRKARMTDVKQIQKLINAYAEQGLMLPRPLAKLYEGLRDFMVAEVDGEVVAVGALHIVWEDLAEVRALAVAPGRERQGHGRALVGELVEEARSLGIRRVFALTYQPGFFERCGFEVVSKESLPHKVWGECINCPKFPNCDEVAMLRTLEQPAEARAETWGEKVDLLQTPEGPPPKTAKMSPYE